MRLLQKLQGRRLETVLVFATIIAALWFAIYVWDIFSTSPFTDFDILFHSAYALGTGHSPYDLNGLRQAPFGPYYKFPPLVDIVLAQFAVLPWNMQVIQVARIYAAFGLLLYGLTFLILIKSKVLELGTPATLLLALGFLLFQPSLDTLYGAQHEFLILFLFTLAYWGLARSRLGEWIAGASIAVVTLIKIYPALLLVYFALRRFWNAAISFIVTCIGLTLISILVAGWPLQKEFWFGIFPALSGGTAWLENQSFFGFFARWFVNGATVNPALTTPLPAATLLSSIAMVITLALSFGVLWRAARPQYAFPILIPLMLLISPNSWIHYETLLLLPLAILLASLTRRAATWEWVILLVAAVLVAYGNEDTVMHTSSGLIQSYKFFGVFLFWVLGLVRAAQAPTEEQIWRQLLPRFWPQPAVVTPLPVPQSSLATPTRRRVLPDETK